MKDKLITLVALCCLGMMLGTILDGAKAQNMSQLGRAPWTKRADRAAHLSYCMKLADDLDRQHCVQRIR